MTTSTTIMATDPTAGPPAGPAAGSADESAEPATCLASRHDTPSARRHHGCICPTAQEKYRRYARFQYAGKAHLSTDVEHRVDATGTRRRIQALYAIGYREDDLARRLGYTQPKQVFAERVCVIPFMHNSDSRRRVYTSTAAKVTALYEALRNEPGPSEHLRQRARRFGWYRPDEWDRADIDDPASTPDIDGTRPRIVETGPDDPWHGALCRSGRYDPDLWAATRGKVVEQVAAVCRRCPVRRHCLAQALITNQRHGMWGGLTDKQRQDLRTALLAELGDGTPLAGSAALEQALDQALTTDASGPGRAKPGGGRS